LRGLLAGALDHFQIAADIGAAPFLVRAELQQLRRERLVGEQPVRTTVAWQLTEKGAGLAAAAGDDRRSSRLPGSRRSTTGAASRPAPKIDPPPT
jgi:hypothetical protein